MRTLRRFLARLSGVAMKHRHEQRLEEEIEQHLAFQIDENLRAGMTPEEARRQAVLKFGAVEAVKEDYRTEGSIPFFETLLQDVRYGVRNMRKSPGFTAVALLTLALGIGGNTVIFSAVNGVLIEHPPYADASRLLVIKRAQVAWGVSLAEFRAMQQECPAFERMASYSGMNQPLTVGDATPVRRYDAYVSGDFFPMLGVKPLLGRMIFPEDTQPGRTPVAVLSYRLWMERFGGDQNVVGRDVVVGRGRYSVIGVMPKEFELGVEWGDESEEGLWMPMLAKASNPLRRGTAGDSIIARGRKGVSIAQVNAQLQPISERFAAYYPKGAEMLQFVAEKPGLRINPDLQTGLLILQGAIGFVLLIASVNISALLVARAWARQKELAIRKALGASRLRVIQQLLTESLLLALAGGALGLLFAIWGTSVLRALAPPGTPRLDRLHLDPNVLWFTLGVSLLSAMLFGLLPAIHASSRRMGGELKGALSGTFAVLVTRQRHALRSGLLIAEVGLAVILVVGGALMARSFDKLMRVDTGVRADRVLTMRVQLSASSCTQANWNTTCALATESVLDGINSLPGIERAALSAGGPIQGGMDWRSGIQIEGAQGEEPFRGLAKAVTPGFFAATGIRLLAGRDFLNSDRDGVTIVSEAFARMYIRGNPLGKRFSPRKDASGNPVWLEIAGEVNDTRDRAVKQIYDGPMYYTPRGFAGNDWQVIARTSVDPMAMVSAVERVVRSADKAAEITNVTTLDQLLYQSAAQPRFQTALLGSFSALALLLAMIGIYGVTSYSVLQRTHEIGVRMALGARSDDVMRLFVGHGGALALVGVVLGLTGALALTRFLRNMLFEVQPTDAATFVTVAALLLAAALAACYFPARRAMRVDPIAALRHE